MAVGVNALWIVPLFGKLDQSILILLPVALLASILPDIDAAGSGAKIHYIGGGVLGIFRGLFGGKYFHHRGLMHSFLAAFFFLIILFPFFQNSYPLLPLVFALAYVSHSIIDGFNTSVGYLYPFVYKRFSFVPKFLRTRVGGPVDMLLFIGGVFCLVLFFLAFRSQLLQ